MSLAEDKSPESDAAARALICALRTDAMDALDRSPVGLAVFLEGQVPDSFFEDALKGSKKRKQYQAWVKRHETSAAVVEAAYHRIHIAKAMSAAIGIKGDLNYLKFLLLAAHKSLPPVLGKPKD